MAPDRRENDLALEAAAEQLGAAEFSRGGVLKRHRGKLGLAVGLAAGLLFSPQCHVTVTAPGQSEEARSASSEGSASGGDPEVRRQVLGVIACGFDENGKPVCIPLSPEMLEEFGKGCEPPEDEISPGCFPGEPESFSNPGIFSQPHAEKKPGVSL